jgi:hypothetical protein
LANTSIEHIELFGQPPGVLRKNHSKQLERVILGRIPISFTSFGPLAPMKDMCAMGANPEKPRERQQEAEDGSDQCHVPAAHCSLV